MRERERETQGGRKTNRLCQVFFFFFFFFLSSFLFIFKGNKTRWKERKKNFRIWLTVAVRFKSFNLTRKTLKLFRFDTSKFFFFYLNKFIQNVFRYLETLFVTLFLFFLSSIVRTKNKNKTNTNPDFKLNRNISRMYLFDFLSNRL